MEKLEANGATSSFAQDIRQEGKDVFNAHFQEDEFAPSILAEYEPSSNTARISLYQKELYVSSPHLARVCFLAS